MARSAGRLVEQWSIRVSPRVRLRPGLGGPVPGQQCGPVNRFHVAPAIVMLRSDADRMQALMQPLAQGAWR